MKCLAKHVCAKAGKEADMRACACMHACMHACAEVLCRKVSGFRSQVALGALSIDPPLSLAEEAADPAARQQLLLAETLSASGRSVRTLK